ncbi:hypothetical protein MLD38_028907 [Melastoma candidum]|uniref:Uncharacterized protein n=1 Tax=Melastoma candidum TaxID=119954 RepID=A0ACB9N2G0_9MYRT|nr:hypothetical protein MLD38_028907 [Melastoma candidum]
MPSACAVEIIHTISLIKRGLVAGQVVNVCSKGLTDVGLKKLEFNHMYNSVALLESSVVQWTILGGERVVPLVALASYIAYRQK